MKRRVFVAAHEINTAATSQRQISTNTNYDRVALWKEPRPHAELDAERQRADRAELRLDVKRQRAIRAELELDAQRRRAIRAELELDAARRRAIRAELELEAEKRMTTSRSGGDENTVTSAELREFVTYLKSVLSSHK